jgi:DNA-binding NtrC family response regulator
MILWQPGVTLEDIEKQVIQKAFSFYRGNKTATAKSLGIAIRTLDAKLEKYDKQDKKAVTQ